MRGKLVRFGCKTVVLVRPVCVLVLTWFLATCFVPCNLYNIFDKLRKIRIFFFGWVLKIIGWLVLDDKRKLTFIDINGSWWSCQQWCKWNSARVIVFFFFFKGNDNGSLSWAWLFGLWRPRMSPCPFLVLSPAYDRMDNGPWAFTNSQEGNL